MARSTITTDSHEYSLRSLQDYLVSLHELHEDWLVHQNKFKQPAPVLVSSLHTKGPVTLRMRKQTFLLIPV